MIKIFKSKPALNELIEIGSSNNDTKPIEQTQFLHHAINNPNDDVEILILEIKGKISSLLELRNNIIFFINDEKIFPPKNSSENPKI